MSNREWTHKWPLHWFQCPSCGHRSFVSVTKTTVAPAARKLSWQFWCDQCHRKSVLRRPHLNTGIWFGAFAPAMAFVFFWGTPVIGWIPSIIIAVLLILLGGLITRVTNAYVQVGGVEP